MAPISQKCIKVEGGTGNQGKIFPIQSLSLLYHFGTESGISANTNNFLKQIQNVKSHYLNCTWGKISPSFKLQLFL